MTIDCSTIPGETDMEMGNRFMRHGRSNSSLDGACTEKKSERKERSLIRSLLDTVL
jgi:hypothetical protein